MSVRSYFINGKLMREHINVIDIFPGMTGYRCAIIVWPRNALLQFFMRGFKQRHLHDYFDTQVKPCSICRKCLIFRPIRPFCPPDKMKDLLNFLVKCHLMVVWKEDGHGYEIDALGNIKRHWELDKPAQTVLALGPTEVEIVDGGPHE